MRSEKAPKLNSEMRCPEERRALQRQFQLQRKEEPYRDASNYRGMMRSERDPKFNSDMRCPEERRALQRRFQLQRDDEE